jgi:class 3 adenylate cyclase
MSDISEAGIVRDVERLHALGTDVEGLDPLQVQAVSCRAKGLIHLMHGKIEAALKMLDESLAACIDLHDKLGEALNLMSIGMGYRSLGDAARSIEVLHRGLEIAEALEERTLVGRLQLTIGSVHADLCSYNDAMMHFHSALSLFEECDHTVGLALVYSNMGIVTSEMGNHEEALRLMERSLEYHKRTGNTNGEGIVHNAIGIVYGNTGRVKEAEESLRRGQAMRIAVGDHEGAVISLANIVGAYLNIGDIEGARALLPELLSAPLQSAGWNLRRRIFQAIVMIADGALSEAEEILQDVLATANRTGQPADAMLALMKLRDLAEQKNDLKAYISYNNEWTARSNEKLGAEQQRKFAQLEAQRTIERQRIEHDRLRSVLHSTLPENIAQRIAAGEHVLDTHSNAAVVFADISGFTVHTSDLSSDVVASLLESVFHDFDAICRRHSVTKIKTIGDSYMAVAFDDADSVRRAALCSLEMQAAGFSWPDGSLIRFRIGIHSGPVTAGVIGTERLQYDAWGDTVNVASRMESHGEPGRVHVSESFAFALDPGFESENRGRRTENVRHPGESRDPSNADTNDSMTHDSMTLLKRGEVSIKGKGPMTTYWLEGVRS